MAWLITETLKRRPIRSVWESVRESLRSKDEAFLRLLADVQKPSSG